MSDGADEQKVPTIYERLAAPFDVSGHATVNKGGSNQTYAPWTTYVERLNSELQANWSFRVVREGFTETECWVLGEITATIDGVVVTRQQYGCEAIAKGGKPVSDLMKSAASDAIKKAASLLGPGLYLSIKEERMAIEAAMREAVKAEADARAAAARAQRDAQTKPKAEQQVDKAKDAAVITGANPPHRPGGYFCVECQGLVLTTSKVTVPKTRKQGGPMVSVPVADFAPVCEDRLGGFHCPDCYIKKWVIAA